MMAQPQPYPAAIVCGTRTGGTYLSHCLDSHPEVFCTRSEILHGKHAVRRSFPQADPANWARVYLEPQGYRVRCAKLIYGQLRKFREVLDWVVANDGRLVHLTRENTLRCVCSVLFRKMHKSTGLVQGRYATHNVGPIRPFEAVMDVDALLNGMRARRKQEQVWDRNLARLGRPLLRVGYDQITGGEHVNAEQIPEATSRELCAFLGVTHRELTPLVTKTNRWPLKAVIRNWDEVEAAVAASPFARCLEDEEAFDG